MSSTNEIPEFQVFKTVFFHCIIIIVMPVISFFISKVFLFDGLFNMDTVPSNVYAAVVSIVVLHIALGSFIYRAYFDSQPKTQSKID
ncbi:vacuolar ATPase assembly integral membrane protein VMA21 homolog [Athalia rosae]|uniref:vacuolar ATPase assembly integral membrane protein VMA21 homolog n=1 Tax=Athalia rosae TaxID=37344 RepID=UPI00062668FA|nr:vacuolar ATPase assembly integral membrane protein VMA21 homolog [Athalia rosae]